MKRENDLQTLQLRIAEPETENAALRAELQELQRKRYGESPPSKHFYPPTRKPGLRN